VPGINSLSTWPAFDRWFAIQRPSNHVEGRHHWLNLGSVDLTDLIYLLLQVCQYFMDAYQKRCENLIASLKRNRPLVFRSDEDMVTHSFNPAKWKYTCITASFTPWFLIARLARASRRGLSLIARGSVSNQAKADLARQGDSHRRGMAGRPPMRYQSRLSYPLMRLYRTEASFWFLRASGVVGFGSDFAGRSVQHGECIPVLAICSLSRSAQIVGRSYGHSWPNRTRTPRLPRPDREVENDISRSSPQRWRFHIVCTLYCLHNRDGISAPFMTMHI
jgi:hypothetical protein